MTFEIDKKNALTKLDKSKKGDIDKQIISLINIINKNPNYYTSSSCSGRIILFTSSDSGKKDEVKWLFVSHDKVSFKDLKKHIKPVKQTLWLRQESFILHVCCRTIEDAEIMLNKLRNLGFKRAGIISLKKIVIEVINTPNISTIIGKNNKILISNLFIKAWLNQANKNMQKNQEKIKQLEKELIF